MLMDIGTTWQIRLNNRCEQVATVFRECNKFASVYTLVALSVDRFLATFHQFARFRQIRCGVLACAAIWTVCLALSTPYWLYSQVVHCCDRTVDYFLFTKANIQYQYHKTITSGMLPEGITHQAGSLYRLSF